MNNTHLGKNGKNYSRTVVAQNLIKQVMIRLALILSFATGACTAFGAGITWQTPTTVVGDTDVSTAGTLVYAYNCSGSASTVNGVTFASGTTSSGAGANLSFSPSFGGNWDGFGSTSNPFNALSTAYKVLLANSRWLDTSGASVTITMSNLTAGRSYAVQFWVNDSRSSTRTETLTSTGGNTVTLAYDSTQSAGGVGQFSIGTFTASGTTQAFTVTQVGGANNVQLNAIQVRDITITKAPAGTDLTAGASWTGGVAPASGNMATWDSTSLGTGLTIGSSISWLGISAPSAASDIAISGSGVLTLGSGGIDMSAAANNLSSANPITLGTSQIWTVNSGKTLTASGAVNGVQAGRLLTKSGSGTLTFSGSTDNGSLRAQVSAGTMILGKTSSGSVHAVGSGGGTDYALTVAGGTAQLGGSGGDQIYNNSAVNMTAGTFDMNGQSETFDGLTGTGGRILNNASSTTSTLTLGANNSSGSPTFSGAITNGAGAVALTKTGTGTQTLTGANGYSGSSFVRAGTLVIDTGGSVNNSSFNSVGLSAGDSGTLTLQNSGSFTTSAEVNVGDNGTTASPAVGTLNISGSANLAASFVVVGSAIGGSTAGANGTVNQSGGTVTTSQGGDTGMLVGGRSSGSTQGIGTYNLSGGTVNVNNNGNVWIGGYGKGTNNQTGGTFNSPGWTAIGRHSGSTGAWNISGGTLNHTGTGTRINVGESGTGTLNVSGSAQVTTAGGVRISVSSGGIGTVNLNGGTITTPMVEAGSGSTPTFNFNGGTLRASASTTTFMQGLTAANVQNGGALIDCQANNITIGQPLLNGGSGGLRKLGSGTLTLTGTSTFTGPTIINGTTAVGVPPANSAGGLVLNNTIASTSVTIGNYSSSLATGNALLQLGVDNAFSATPALSFDGLNGANYAYLKLMGRTLTVASITQVEANNTGNTSAIISNDGGDSGSAGQVGTLIVSNSVNNTFAGRMRDNTGGGSGTGGFQLIKKGSATLFLTGPFNTPQVYTKGTTIQAGTLDISGISGTGFSAGAPITNSGGIFNIGGLNLSSVTALQLTGGGTINGTGSITNNTANYDLQSGTINPALHGSVGITKSTAGTVTLTGNNSLGGAVTLNAGTLALSGSGAISSAASLNIAGGATFDVSALSSSTFNLSGSTSLSASGTGTTVGATAATIKGASSGTVNLGSRPITLTYDGSHPALFISQGTLALDGNAFTVNSPSPLPAGTYAVIQQASGNVVSSGTFTVTGTAISFGTIAAINVNGGNVNLVISSKTNSLAIFGSSVAKGAGSSGANANVLISGGSYSNSWAALLTTNLLAKSYVITNDSVPGDNSAGGVSRFGSVVVPQHPKYVLISYSLGNDNLGGGSNPDSITSTFLANLTNMVAQCFSNGFYPVVGLPYARNDIESAGRYTYMQGANLTINGWSVPSINLDGVLNNSTGGLISAINAGDGIHPNDYGHAEIYYSIPPTICEALTQGKTNRPALASATNFARLTQMVGVTSPLVFTPTNTMHSFTMAFKVRATGNGTIAAIRTGSGYATLQITNGQFAYVGTNGSSITTSSISATNGDWHDVALSFRYALTNTWLFVDGVQVGSLSEQYAPDQFILGGPAASGAPTAPSVLDLQNWCVYRAAWNPLEAQAQAQGSLQQASMEIGAMLDDSSFASNSPAVNRAQSLSVAMVNTAGVTPMQSVVPPSNLSASSLSGTSVRLVWTRNSTTESGFVIERRVNGSSAWSFVAAVPAGTTNYTNTGLTSGIAYQYRVAAQESGLQGNYSNIATVTAGIGTHQTILVDFGPNDVTNGDATGSPDWLGQYWNNVVGAGGAVALTPFGAANLVAANNASTTIGISSTGSGWLANGKLNGGLLTPSFTLLGNFAVTNATEDYFFTQSAASMTVTNLDPSQNYRLRLFGTRNANSVRISRYVVTGANGPFTNLLQTSGATWTNNGAAYNGNNDTIASIPGVVPNGSSQIQLDVSIAAADAFAYLGIMEIAANRSPVAQPLTIGCARGATVSFAVIGGKHEPTDPDGDGVSVTGVSGAIIGGGVASVVGGTSLSYTADNTSVLGTNTFTYTVTDTFGGTDTKTVTVLVYHPEGFNRLSPPSPIGNGSVALTYLGIPGYNYVLDWATNLTPPIAWTPVQTNVAATNGYLTFTNSSSAPVNFFRTRYVP